MLVLTCFVMTNTFLSRQKYACRDRTFVTTNISLSQQKLCCDKHICHNKHNFVMTEVLSWQAYFCCDKRHVLWWQTCVCHDKHMFVTTKTIFVAAPANGIFLAVTSQMHSCGAGLISKHNCVTLTEPDTNEDKWKTGNIQYGAVKGYGNQHNNSRMLRNCGPQAIIKPGACMYSQTRSCRLVSTLHWGLLAPLPVWRRQRCPPPLRHPRCWSPGRWTPSSARFCVALCTHTQHTLPVTQLSVSSLLSCNSKPYPCVPQGLGPLVWEVEPRINMCFPRILATGLRGSCEAAKHMFPMDRGCWYKIYTVSRWCNLMFTC